MYKERAEVSVKFDPVLDDKGKQKKDKNGKPLYKPVIESVGTPLTLLALASKIEQRANDKKLKVDAIKGKFAGDKYHYPEGATVSGVRWDVSKDDPKRLVMSGTVNGVKVKPVVLSEEVSFALRNKLVTLEQAFMENKELRTQALSLNKGVYRANVEQNAIDAMVSRVCDTSAKAFTPEQVDAINAAVGKSKDRGEAIKALWEKAEPVMLGKGADKGWFESAKQELNAVAANTWEQKPEGVGVSR